MSVERATMRAARAVHARIARTVDQLPGRTSLAVVRRLEPLEAELAEEATVLTRGEDFEMSAQAEMYEGQLKVGDMLIVHETAGGSWLATDVLSDVPLEGGAGGGAITYHEVPSGAVNGVNVTFTTAAPFSAGSLQVFLNGLLLVPSDYAATPAAGTFVLGYAPAAGDALHVHYEAA